MTTTPPSLISTATAQALEFPSLLAVLSRLAASDLGRDRVLALVPAVDEEDLRLRRRRYEEASRVTGGAGSAAGAAADGETAGGPLVPDFDVPLGELLARLITGRPPFEGIDLVRIADLLRASRAAARRLATTDPPVPELARLAAGLPDLSDLLRRIDRTFDRRGEVREDASPRLAALRGQIRKVRDQLYRDLGEFVSQHKEELSEDTVPMRGGRLVLMLQAGSRGRTKGLVHGRSATGKSFYFEPLHVVESNNNLQQSVEDEEAERRRIVAELVLAARTALPALETHGQFLGELDLLQAALRFAEVSEGHLAEIGPPQQLRLLAARHPLLDPRLAELRALALGQAGHSGRIVPVDIELGAPGDGRVLVVTGPNAGGKTVSLKTTGMLALIAQCGLPIPAAPGSRLPLFSRLVATVGDEQDLLADRSTFSGRLLRLKEAWESAGPGSLVLLDELGSGTDPEEGSALAISLLEGLLHHGSLGVITTHLTQLAAAALEMDGASCAAMEFDPQTGRPTFRLLPGPPGGSEALALARRLGLPAEWLDRAEARLGSGHRDLRRLLAEVDRVRRELTETRERLEVEAADAEKLRRRLAAELSEAEEVRRTVGKKLKTDLEAFRRDTLTRLRAEVERLRGEVEGGRRRGLEAEAIERLFAEAPELDPAEAVALGALVVGQKARHLRFGWEGVVEKLDADRAQVAVRGKRMSCHPGDLIGLGAGPAGAAGARAAVADLRERVPPPSGARRGGKPDSDLDAAAEAPPEVNLIGQRVEPALELLDAYLDQAVLTSRREVRVIHGHGTGRLRQAVREHLRGHRAVASQRSGEPNEGGNGATVVTLKGA